jgi:hypothetical protein
MGFQSIFAWQALPEAGFANKAQLLMLIDPWTLRNELAVSVYPWLLG